MFYIQYKSNNIQIYFLLLLLCLNLYLYELIIISGLVYFLLDLLRQKQSKGKVMSKYIIGCLISASIAITYTFAVGHNSRTLHSIPSFYLLVFGIHLIQVIAFIPAKIMNTQKFYDITGSLTFVSAILFCLFTSSDLSIKQIIAAALVILWTARLGGFLFYRILKTGQDSRFVKIKQQTLRFFMAWFIQGLWVTITGGPVYVFLTKLDQNISKTGFTSIQLIGILIWFTGFLIQSVSDYQKFVFNEDNKNSGKFMCTGLWSYSRHPNYCGEIILWFGTTIFVSQSLHKWEMVSLICPFFVYFLLSKVSGVPLLEAKADKKWGNTSQYQTYKAKTPILFPWSSEISKSIKKTNE